MAYLIFMNVQRRVWKSARDRGELQFQPMTRILLAVWIGTAALAAQAPDARQIDRVFEEYQKPNSPGCAVAVESGGRESFGGAYGLADLEHRVANMPGTVFEAGSVSKQFTAAAVMVLVERGQVSLDDDVRKYFPELPKYERTITVRQLLNHTSGLRDWGEMGAIAGAPRGTRAYRHAHVLDILSRQRSLNYPPGEAWSYTNSGYNLSAMLVERVTGMSLQAFCRKEFFEPLGMTSTQWRDDFRRVVADRAIAYQPRGTEWRQDMPFEDVFGQGGLLTTVGDMLKWNRNMTGGKVHSSVFAVMSQPSALTNGHPVQYGLGFFLEEFEGIPEISHAGATAGYRAWLGRFPGKDLSVAVLCNAASANAPRMGHEVAAMYLGVTRRDPVGPVTGFAPGLYRSTRDHAAAVVGGTESALTMDGRRVESRVRFEGDKMMVTSRTYGEDVWERVEAWTPGDLTEFAGSYESDEARTIFRVAVENGGLVIHRNPDDSFVLKPSYRDAFQCPMGSVRFLRDPGGKVSALSLGNSRVWDLRFVRQGAGR